nr:LytR C-terminal domain-containing protein [Roseateles chitosanitabidus]
MSNGVGTTGMAAKVDRWMVEQGMPKSRLTNQPSYDVVRTRVDYRAGQAESARRIAAALPPGVPSQLCEQAGLRGDVRVVIGRDWLAATATPRRVAALAGGLDATSDL